MRIRYRPPSPIGCLFSAIIWGIIGIILGGIIGAIAAKSATALLIFAGIGLLVGLGQAGKNYHDAENDYIETQKIIMQKVQTGVPLSQHEQALWDYMNNNVGGAMTGLQTTADEVQSRAAQQPVSEWSRASALKKTLLVVMGIIAMVGIGFFVLVLTKR